MAGDTAKSGAASSFPRREATAAFTHGTLLSLGFDQLVHTEAIGTDGLGIGGTAPRKPPPQLTRLPGAWWTRLPLLS